MTETRARAKIESAIKNESDLAALGEWIIWLAEMEKLTNQRFEELDDEQY